jgi:murein DD-endopeptidase MepM/ murein hydrolase activator NlpD
VAFALFAVASRAEDTADGVLNIFTQDEGGTRHFYVRNLTVGTVTATFNTKLENMTASVDFPATVTVPGNQTVEVFTLTPASNKLKWHYNYNFACNLGNASAVPDGKQVYELPYEPGTAHQVVQGHHGKFSHMGENEFAIDWKMPEGTPVCAARDGLVVKSKDDSTEGGPDRKYEKLANCIFVQHADGTIGAYLHLQAGGNKVKVGDRVKAGDVIGLSGNTGFSSGPHLHFAVFTLKSGSERTTLPVKFRTANSDAVIPVSGRGYMAALKPSSPVAATESRVTRSGS